MLQIIVLKGQDDQNIDFTMYIYPETCNVIIYKRINDTTTAKIPMDHWRFKEEFLRCVPDPSIFDSGSSERIIENIVNSAFQHFFPKEKTRRK